MRYDEEIEPLSVAEHYDLKGAIRQQYWNSSVGGNLHIVLDDYNVADHHILWCLFSAIPRNFHKTETQLETKIAIYLLRLPKKERKEVILKAKGCL